MADGWDTDRHFDSILSILAHPSTRAAMYCLREDREMEYAELGTRLERSERFQNPEVELHHRVLPRLRAYGVIESHESGSVRLHASEDLDRMVAAIAQFDDLQESVLDVDD